MATLYVQPIRVLVVDDEPKITLTLAASLEKLGDEFVVDRAHSFDEAFSRVQRRRYALVITDHRLPGLSGLDLARAVQQISPATQIVLMTAYSTGTMTVWYRRRLCGHLEATYDYDSTRLG